MCRSYDGLQLDRLQLGKNDGPPEVKDIEDARCKGVLGGSSQDGRIRGDQITSIFKPFSWQFGRGPTTRSLVHP